MRISLRALVDWFPTLRLIVPACEVPLRDSVVAYGVRRLPVAW
jgi:hypothetical protein